MPLYGLVNNAGMSADAHPGSDVHSENRAGGAVEHDLTDGAQQVRRPPHDGRWRWSDRPTYLSVTAFAGYPAGCRCIPRPESLPYRVHAVAGEGRSAAWACIVNAVASGVRGHQHDRGNDG